MARFDLSDFEWSVIEPLLPTKVRGVARVDDRRVLNGIFWRLRTGAPWADIPSRYGPCTTEYRSEEHTSELQSLMRISYAVFCLKKKTAEYEKIIYAKNNYTKEAVITL